ncbi:MAG TPA: glycosyltransferase [Vicinamibacterales bacterium]|nr:glycosyltransferase [Vicinamibacterales bacterium]
MTIRTLHVLADAAPSSARRRVRLLVQGLESLGQPAVLAARTSDEFSRAAAEGLRFLDISPKSAFDVEAGWHLARLIGDVKPDVVHAHDAMGVALSAMALQMRHEVTPAPSLVDSRRTDLHLDRRAFARFTHSRVDAYLAASEVIHRLLLDDGVPADRVTTVHDGVNVRAIDHVQATDIHAEFWLPHGAPVVGNAATLVRHKGHRYLVAAAALVVPKVPDARFLIIGDGDQRPALDKQIADLGLERHVVLAGHRADALALVKALDIFVSSSITESLGSAVLEAMACRRPVVGTRAGGIKDAIVDGETGLLVPPQDEQALASAIVSLLGDAGLRARLAEAGRQRVETTFSVERQVARTLEVYRRLRGRQ